MANQLFAGFVYTDAGAVVVGATADLLDRNTLTPVRATTTTDASGYWAISHATEGRFDVRITNGSSIRFIKYDDSVQLETIEAAVLRVRNPADTFDYDIVPGAITADRQLNLPVITGTDTVAVLALAQTFLTGLKTFNSSILAIRNPADTFSYTIAGAAILADRVLTLPLATGADTLAALGVAQTWTGTQTFGAVTLGGVVSGGGQQVNNVIIGAVTPLAGTFTALVATSLNLQNGALNNVGDAGNDWTANSLTLSNANSGAVNRLYVVNSATTASSQAILRAEVPANVNALGDPLLHLIVTGTSDFTIAIDNDNSDRLRIGAGPDAGTWDGLRMTYDTVPVITYNTTHPTGTFDWVCETCGKHGPAEFACCGLVMWHDDVAALAPVLAAADGRMLRHDTPGVRALARLGVLDLTRDNEGQEEVFIHLQNAQWFTWSGMAQMYRHLRELERRLALAGLLA